MSSHVWSFIFEILTRIKESIFIPSFVTLIDLSYFLTNPCYHNLTSQPFLPDAFFTNTSHTSHFNSGYIHHNTLAIYSYLLDYIEIEIAFNFNIIFQCLHCTLFKHVQLFIRNGKWVGLPQFDKTYLISNSREFGWFGQFILKILKWKEWQMC